MGLRGWDSSQEAVQVVHGQRKDLFFTLLLLTDLQSESGRVRGDSEKIVSETEGKKKKA